MRRLEGDKHKEEFIDDLLAAGLNYEQCWSAMVNIAWRRQGYEVGFSFREAGGYLADRYNAEQEKAWQDPNIPECCWAHIDYKTYLDYYCCGPYAHISDEAAEFMLQRGWIPEYL